MQPSVPEEVERKRLAVFRRGSHLGCTALLAATLGVIAATPALVAETPNAGSRASQAGGDRVAATPPMGWNDWAHYQCHYTAQTVVDNARMLVRTGLAARGYDTVTIDDCWMRKTRGPHGNLRADPKRFPHGMAPLVRAVHELGLKFGIYEDAGSSTCAGFAASGEPKGGGADHFAQDARLFAAWGVDYLKLDGCNVFVPRGGTKLAAYRRAYAAESAALQHAGRPITFSESAPAYFMGTPNWYDVLSWVPQYGQLWREGTDIQIFNRKKPDASRFASILRNYAYNQPLGRFQSPGHYDDPDFIIGGDRGVTRAETRSQMALWSMMSAPLILSSNLSKLSPGALAVLSNPAVIAVDQDPLGRMATLIRRTPQEDVLFKTLSRGAYAIAVLNRGLSPLEVKVPLSELGFPSGRGCHAAARNLWSGRTAETAVLSATVAPHDTAIWRVQPAANCGAPAAQGAIVMTAIGASGGDGRFEGVEEYGRCLYANGQVEPCRGTAGELWTWQKTGRLESGGKCLGVTNGKPEMQKCSRAGGERWNYTLAGNLVNASTGECLTAVGAAPDSRMLAVRPCGHDQPNQIWSLPN